MGNIKQKRRENRKNQRLGILSVVLFVFIALIILGIIFYKSPTIHHVPVEAPTPEAIP